MATNYGERMARLEEKTDNIEKKVDMVINKLDNLENVFVSRREVTVMKWFIGLGFSVIGIYLAFRGLK